jgi:hypothetical protein
MPCYAYQGIVPVVDPSSYVHPLASLIGDVIVGPGCFIAPGASLRGDFGRRDHRPWLDHPWLRDRREQPHRYECGDPRQCRHWR